MSRPDPVTTSRSSLLRCSVRGALALAAMVSGYISVMHDRAFAIRSIDPLKAHRLAPTDGRISALAAQQLAGLNADAAARARADALARMALRQDPTAVVAVSTLGLNAQVRGDVAGARRLFAYANYLSRRELQTQIWGIEDAVSRGDISDALRQYDTALRVSRIAPDLLFPVLSVALSEPAVRSGLIRLLAGNPPWGASFVNFVSANTNSSNAVLFFLGLSQQGVLVTEEPRARIIDRLIAQAKPVDAWNYYVHFRKNARRDTSRDPRFTAELKIPTAFDWVAINDDMGIATTIGRGRVAFAAPVSVGGALLRQIQLLPSGNYRIVGRSSEIRQAPDAHPYWTLRCSDGREVETVEIPNSDQAGGIFTGRFEVPPGCGMQTLELAARPSEAVGGLTGQINRVQVDPLAVSGKTP